jgi:cellulose biosynthesis protein BcsQ
VIVVAVYNMKGGVGKTTTAVNLAYHAAASGARTLLWDLDPQAASSFTFRVQPEVEGFGQESLQRIDTLTEAIKATDYDNLDLLPADFAYRKLDRFLHRLGRPDRDLTEVIQKLGREYDYVLLDCPPGLSILSENVFFAADLILVPTIPTVLSLRTLSRLVEHVGERGKGEKLTAFLSMVDRRKVLHRHICEWTLRHPEFFLAAQVPYASVIEQMTVHRTPLAAVCPQDAAASAFDALWRNVQARLAHSAPAAMSAKTITDLIAQIGGEVGPDAMPDAPSQSTISAAAPAEMQTCAYRVRLEVGGEDAFESLALELSAVIPPATTQLSHIFDTEDGTLLRAGYLVQLLEEGGSFAVALETSEGEMPVAAIDSCWAADILAESLSPITVLERRLKQSSPSLVSAVAAVALNAGKQSLRRVAWRQRLRRRVGPIIARYERERVTLHFAFDQVSGPDGEIGYEIEARASGASARNCEQALRELFSRAGINWRPLTVRRPSASDNGETPHPAKSVAHGEFVKTRG